MILIRSWNDVRIPLLVRYVYMTKGRLYSFRVTIMLRLLRIGYHVPATRRRDLFYAKLEREREENQGTV